MSFNRRNFLLAGSAIGASLVASPSIRKSGAQEASLMFATANPAQTAVVANMLAPWANRINEKGKGVVNIDVRNGTTLANNANFWDRVKSDTVQISWGIQAYIAGKFPASQAPSLPFISDNAEEASVAYWRLIKSGILEGEYSDVAPLFSCVFAQSRLHMRRSVERVDDLKGLKIGAATPVIAELLTRLGATPISITILQYYEALQRGTVDGVVTPWSAFAPFKLHEVTSYHVELPFGTGVGMVLMAKSKFDSLPAAARDAIMEHSGERQSKNFGAFWDGEQDKGRADVKALSNHTIVNPAPEQAAKLREIFEPIRNKWAEGTPNGVKALAAYEKYLTDVRSGN
jgi:TRAP-type C4-dicarboxylate transport system substrate-binding protein